MKEVNWIKIGDLFKIVSGGTPNTSNKDYYDNGTIPWVKTGDLKVKDLEEIPNKITSLGLENSSALLHGYGKSSQSA